MQSIHVRLKARFYQCLQCLQCLIVKINQKTRQNVPKWRGFNQYNHNPHIFSILSTAAELPPSPRSGASLAKELSNWASVRSFNWASVRGPCITICDGVLYLWWSALEHAVQLLSLLRVGGEEEIFGCCASRTGKRCGGFLAVGESLFGLGLFDGLKLKSCTTFSVLGVQLAFGLFAWFEAATGFCTNIAVIVVVAVAFGLAGSAAILRGAGWTSAVVRSIRIVRVRSRLAPHVLQIDVAIIAVSRFAGSALAIAGLAQDIAETCFPGTDDEKCAKTQEDNDECD